MRMSSGLTCFIVAIGFPSQQADAIRSGYSNSANHAHASPIVRASEWTIATPRAMMNFDLVKHSRDCEEQRDAIERKPPKLPKRLWQAFGLEADDEAV
ncbi:MAG: hypothetical protein ACREDJ_11295 [Methylocella sp.]